MDAETSPPAKTLKVQWKTPPRRSRGILRSLGPGLIIAGSIVGSGELVATTKTGAEAGFWLLWLIVIGCVIMALVLHIGAAEATTWMARAAWMRAAWLALWIVAGVALPLFTVGTTAVAAVAGCVLGCWAIVTAFEDILRRSRGRR